MKRFLLCVALSTSAIAHAQVISQRSIEVAGNTGFIERQVKVPDFTGKEVVVTQILKPNADGSLTYIHRLQPRETQEFDRSFCTLQGATLKSEGETILGSETLAGVFCESHGDKSPKAGIRANGVWLQPIAPQEDGAESSNLGTDLAGQLVVLQAYAPKNFAVPVKQNYLYHGRAQAITNTAGMAVSQLQIGDGCRIGKQDWIGANTSANLDAEILCYANRGPAINTAMTTCLLGRCATDTGVVTIF